VGLLRANQAEDAMRTFVPETCEEILTEHGARFDRTSGAQLKLDLRPIPDDVRIALIRFLRLFSRNSGTTENTISLKLGTRLHLFNKVLLPALLQDGVIRRTQYHGSGAQERYELSFPIDTILAAEDPSSSAPAQLVAFWNGLR
jgi:hypothetical protein